MNTDIRGISLGYSIKRNSLYLQGVEPNENYCKSAMAPTMGARHSFCEYKAVWGKELKIFEPITAINYLKIVFEQYRWRRLSASSLKIDVYFDL